MVKWPTYDDLIPDSPYRRLNITYGWDDGPWVCVTYLHYENYREAVRSVALACTPLPGVAHSHRDASIIGASPPDYSQPPE